MNIINMQILMPILEQELIFNRVANLADSIITKTGKSGMI